MTFLGFLLRRLLKDALRYYIFFIEMQWEEICCPLCYSCFPHSLPEKLHDEDMLIYMKLFGARNDSVLLSGIHLGGYVIFTMTIRIKYD